MSEFLQYVLYLLKNSIVLVLLAGVLAAAVLAVVFLIHRKKYKGQKKFPWGRIFLWTAKNIKSNEAIDNVIAPTITRLKMALTLSIKPAP